jgi:hypothetical protein
MLSRIVLAFALVGLILPMARAPTAQAATPTPDQIKTAITNGLAWLATQQVLPDGYFQDPAHPNYHRVGLTGLAVLKFEDHAAHLGKDPFDDNPASPTYYEYAHNVIKGWDYLSSQMYTVTPLADQGVNDPEQYTDHDDIGMYFSSGAPVYETGIVMMALEASGNQGRTFPGHPRPGVDDTFRGVLEDCADYMAWAQSDGGNGEGGWRYSPYDNQPGVSDNSVSQWPALGLMAAEAWGIKAPDFVKDKLEHKWLAYSQQSTSGCFGYNAPGSYASGNYGSAGPFAVTAAGMTELTYCGVPTTDSRWSDAAQCICDNWSSLGENGNIGNGYAMYALMKTAMTAQPQPPNPVWDFCGHKWQPEYDQWLVDNQVKPDGYWPAKSALPWQGTEWDKVLATEYALLILQKVVPVPATPTPTPTPTATRAPVGGAVKLPAAAVAAEAGAAAEGSGWGTATYAALAGVGAAAAIGVGGWYARRRWLR